MATTFDVAKTRPGWNFKAYLGCDTDDTGHAMKGTADRIVGGWAASHERAVERANDVIAEGEA